jgi:putative ABC transport system permease protein
MINIGGLAIGLATCFVILLFVRHELSYDDFHEHADRIHRIVSFARNGDTISEKLVQSAALAPAVVREVPGIESAVRVSTRYTEVLVKRADAAFYEDSFYFTDSSFFEIFHAPFLRGNAEQALARPSVHRCPVGIRRREVFPG